VTPIDPDERTRRLAAESLSDSDPTGWFERLYAAAEQGRAIVPWDRGAPHRMLVQWAQARELGGAGRRAVIVGSGLGDDAEYIAGLGFDTVAFDVAPTAVRAARRRFPDSPVEYIAADLLDPPAAWRNAFDLVVESLTVQSLPDRVRPTAIAHVSRLVAAGGTLLVIATARDAADGPVHGPPWPLTRAEIEAFTGDGLRPVRIEHVPVASEPLHRWRAEFVRA
jgi:SAM-dependent methyltransferase